ncbi:hypothetical protein UPYG_G00247510 [Umbra pygmaea]|uniref:Uncharacterized protein n=1 Tax=Umbra pygmaea TaxID=75934 RepID=A0ABD0WS14_UMBPY
MTVPQPKELVKRVEDVLHHFHLAKDPNNVLLFKDKDKEPLIYRYGGTLQLKHIKGEGAAVPIWIPVRGTSQQEGYHFHQAQWVTGHRRKILTGVYGARLSSCPPRLGQAHSAQLPAAQLLSYHPAVELSGAGTPDPMVAKEGDISQERTTTWSSVTGGSTLQGY